MTATERQNWVWIQHLRLQSPHASCLGPGAGIPSTLLSSHDENSTRKQDPEPSLGFWGGATALFSGSLLGCVLACDGAKQSIATQQAGRRSLSLITGSRHGLTTERHAWSVPQKCSWQQHKESTGESLAIIYLGFKKAFDIVAHKRLIF